MKYTPRKNLKKDDYDNLLDGVKKWVGYWRKNVEIFVEDYLGIHLYPFQKILIHQMSVSNWNLLIATRGLRQIMDNCCLLLCYVYFISRNTNMCSIR